MLVVLQHVLQGRLTINPQARPQKLGAEVRVRILTHILGCSRGQGTSQNRAIGDPSGITMLRSLHR